MIQCLGLNEAARFYLLFYPLWEKLNKNDRTFETLLETKMNISHLKTDDFFCDFWKQQVGQVISKLKI